MAYEQLDEAAIFNATRKISKSGSRDDYLKPIIEDLLRQAVSRHRLDGARQPEDVRR